jgi:hypothetical protein
MSAGRWGHLSRLTESPTRVEVTEATRCDATPRHRRRQTCAGRSRTRRSCPSVTSNFVDNQRFSLPLALLDFSKPPAARLLSYLPGTIRRSERVARRRAHRMLAPGLIDGGRRCRTHAPQVQSLASATPRGHGPARRAAFRRSVWSLTSTSPTAIGRARLRHTDADELVDAGEELARAADRDAARRVAGAGELRQHGAGAHEDGANCYQARSALVRRPVAARRQRTGAPRGAGSGTGGYAETGMRRGLDLSPFGSVTSSTPFTRRAEIWSRSKCSALVSVKRRR